MLNKSKNHDTFERGIIKQNIRLHKRKRDQKFEQHRYLSMKLPLNDFCQLLPFYNPEINREPMAF